MTQFSIETFLKAYETDTVETVIGGRRFSFYTPRSIERFIDPKDALHDFPLWSKVWEASLVLADELAQTTPSPNRKILEIGCGLGVAGIVAAAFGHDVTLTEHNAHALEFARANAHTNLAAQGTEPRVLRLDWNRPELEGLFDLILGSEVVYSERDYDPLLGLFKRHLQSGGTILLAEGVRRTSLEFFRRMQEHYHISARKKVMRFHHREVPVILASMAPKR